jgi:hypothetical protein
MITIDKGKILEFKEQRVMNWTDKFGKEITFYSQPIKMSFKNKPKSPKENVDWFSWTGKLPINVLMNIKDIQIGLKKYRDKNGTWKESKEIYTFIQDINIEKKKEEPQQEVEWFQDLEKVFENEK